MKERERNINVWLLLMHPLLETWHATQASALTENRTSNPLVRRPVLKPLSHTSQGKILSVMQIYTVFKGIINDKGSTFKCRINLSIRTYYRVSCSRISITFKVLILSPSDLEPCSCKDFWRSSICCCNSWMRSLLSLF